MWLNANTYPSFSFMDGKRLPKSGVLTSYRVEMIGQEAYTPSTGTPNDADFMAEEEGDLSAVGGTEWFSFIHIL
jgi:hypothetical protein